MAPSCKLERSARTNAGSAHCVAGELRAARWRRRGRSSAGCEVAARCCADTRPARLGSARVSAGRQLNARPTNGNYHTARSGENSRGSAGLEKINKKARRARLMDAGGRAGASRPAGPQREAGGRAPSALYCATGERPATSPSRLLFNYHLTPPGRPRLRLSRLARLAVPPARLDGRGDSIRAARHDLGGEPAR